MDTHSLPCSIVPFSVLQTVNPFGFEMLGKQPLGWQNTDDMSTPPLQLGWIAGAGVVEGGSVNTSELDHEADDVAVVVSLALATAATAL